MTRPRRRQTLLPASGREPHLWQLDFGEAFILKLDGVITAGTGTGKTIPFMLPLLINPTKYLLIISPMNVLQHERVSSISYVTLGRVNDASISG
jgi:ATP-dependent helicase YprA (DUF1998 family)